MKTKEELDALKKEAEALNEKLSALTEEELEQVTGGAYQRAKYGALQNRFEHTVSNLATC